MRSAIRKPSPRKSLSSRTTGIATRTAKKATTPLYNKKGTGVIKNPKKAACNRIYQRSSVGLSDVSSSRNGRSCKSTSLNSDCSSTVIVTNENLAELLSTHPEITGVLFGCFVRRLLFGILFSILGIAFIAVLPAFSAIFFIIAVILFYRSRKFFFAYSDAQELSRM